MGPNPSGTKGSRGAKPSRSDAPTGPVEVKQPVAPSDDGDDGNGGEPRQYKATECKITRAEFKAAVKALLLTISQDGPGGQPYNRQVAVAPKEFKQAQGAPAGSFGWYNNDKVELLVNGKLVKCQLGLSITVVGSKNVVA